MKTLQALVAVLALVGFVGSSFAASKASRGKNSSQAEESKPEAKPNKEKGGKSDKDKDKAKGKFSAEEQRVIEEYVKGKRGRDLPPGLRRKMAKGGSLPAGWEKKMSAGEVMPPEVLKVATPLPREIVAKLPPPPPGVITVAVEGKVVRLVQATREILDVFEVGRRR